MFVFGKQKTGRQLEPASLIWCCVLIATRLRNDQAHEIWIVNPILFNYATKPAWIPCKSCTVAGHHQPSVDVDWIPPWWSDQACPSKPKAHLRPVCKAAPASVLSSGTVHRLPVMSAAEASPHQHSSFSLSEPPCHHSVDSMTSAHCLLPTTVTSVAAARQSRFSTPAQSQRIVKSKVT